MAPLQLGSKLMSSCCARTTQVAQPKWHHRPCCTGDRHVPTQTNAFVRLSTNRVHSPLYQSPRHVGPFEVQLVSAFDFPSARVDTKLSPHRVARRRSQTLLGCVGVVGAASIPQVGATRLIPPVCETRIGWPWPAKTFLCCRCSEDNEPTR